MIDKLVTAIAYILMIIIGAIMLPYLLKLAWVRIISLKKELKCQDLALKSSK